jgi:hypothetical protein
MPYARSFERYRPPRRYDGVPFITAAIREAADVAGPYSTVDTITLDPVDTDPSAPAIRNLTTNDATLASGWYVVQWTDGDGATYDSDPIFYPTAAEGWGFASVADVATRLGRDLSDAEAASAEATIASVTRQIAEILGLDDDWADTLEPVPALFEALCIDKALGAISNPGGIASQSLGAFSVTYANRSGYAGAALLTIEDIRAINEAWYTGEASVRIPSVADDLLAYGAGELDDPA